MKNSSGEFEFEYDACADVLYGHRVPYPLGIAEEVEDGILLYRQPVSGVLQGFTIINYKRQREAGYLNQVKEIADLDLPI